MAAALDVVVSHFVEKLITVAENEVKTILGVHAEIKTLRERLSNLQGHVLAAERRQREGDPIRNWLKDLKEVVYEVDDILDEYIIKTEKLQQGLHPSSNLSERFFQPFHSCFVPFSLRSLGNRIKEVNQKLAGIDGRKSDPILHPGAATSLPNQMAVWEAESEVVGTAIDGDTRMLVEMLLKANDTDRMVVYAIAGMGGIGKTTLARKIFQHKMIQDSFIRVAWVDVNKDFEEVTVLKKMIMDFSKQPCEIQNPQDLQNKLGQVVAEEKFFLVLDNVWNTEVWDQLLEPLLGNNAAAGSRVLVTTRDRAIAMSMRARRCHEVQKLPLEEGWSLLCKVVFGGGDEMRQQNLRNIGMRMVDKCDGLPLAVKTIGRVLKRRDLIQAEWEKVAGGDAWSFEHPEEREGIGKRVMNVLYPSYEDLPCSQLKQCFVYCAMFPEDYMLRQDMLVSLWIAEGFIKATDSSMEDTAEDYWQQLVRRSLLRADPGCYHQGGCRMHRVVRSLALYLAQGECFSGDGQGFVKQTADAASGSPKRRRVLIKDEKGVSNLDTIRESTCLRTLIFLDTPLLQPVPEDFLKKFPYLRVLDLSGAQNSKLPDAVQHLIHLRYLNLSRSLITDIPSTIRRLVNLQFLGLADCRRLRILPDAILDLDNLRALDVAGTPLEGIPRGIRKLRNLKRLVGFRVNRNTGVADSGGAKDGDGDDQHGRRRSWCTLEELKHLTQLKILMIQDLERISSKDEADRASLKNSHLDDLRLICSPNQHVVTDKEKTEIKEVFDRLCPPSRLQRLEFAGYFGLWYPVWMMGSSIRSHLQDLKHLELRDCPFCLTLPPLGLLTRLEILHISGAAAVRSIGTKFLLGDAAAVAGQARHRFVAFQMLKQLVLKDMDGWRKWLWWGVVEEEEEEEDPAMALLPLPLPVLEELVIERCDKLKSLPEGLLRNVTRLTIYHAQSLTEIGNLPLVRTLKIAARNLVRIYNLPALEDLTLVDCYELSELKIGELQYLKLEDQTMISLPSWLLNEKEVNDTPHSFISGLSKMLFASGGRRDYIVVRKLEFICTTSLLHKCIEGGPEWPKIYDIPHVRGYNMDKSRYISYTMSNPDLKFETNIKKEEIIRETTTNSSIRKLRATNWSRDLASPFSYVTNRASPFSFVMNRASPFPIVVLLLLVVGVPKLAFDFKSFLVPFLLKAAAAIQKFR